MSSARITAATRRQVASRAQNCCEYCLCQADFSADSFAVEHIVPRSRDGASDRSNLAWACQGCNNHKYDKTEAFDAVTSRRVPLYHPRKDEWRRHFAWSPDYLLIIGLTPIGRATVSALELNRRGLVNLRAVLVAAGEHPPIHHR